MQFDHSKQTRNNFVTRLLVCLLEVSSNIYIQNIINLRELQS